jgi:dTDP-4-dehydrorhamnose reductase
LSSARLITPISDEDLNEQTLLTNFKSSWGDNPEESHHITILSDILPILIALIHDGKAHGSINACNKGTISLHWFEQYLSKQIKKEIIDTETLTDEFDRWNKQLISPETRHLYHALYVLPNASKSIGEYLQQKSINLNPNAPKVLLVTGGCGFIGSTFINHWLKTYPNDQIINIDRLDPVSNTKNIENPQSPNYSFIVADINNKDIVLHLMNQYNVTHIVHFAGKNQ